MNRYWQKELLSILNRTIYLIIFNNVTCMHISACTYMLSVYDFPYKYVLHVEKKFSLVFIFSLFVYFSNKVIHYYTLFLRLFISHTFRVKSHKEVIPYYIGDSGVFSLAS